jgi:hypothetical protein
MRVRYLLHGKQGSNASCCGERDTRLLVAAKRVQRRCFEDSTEV